MGPSSTKKFAASFARSLLRRKRGVGHPLVIGLVGELGAGKTTFVQGFAKALGVREKIVSPSFTIMRVFRLGKKKRFRHLVHIDCWRLKNPSEIKEIGFLSVLRDRDAVILIEWADNIRGLLPRQTVWVSIAHSAQNKREIVVRMANLFLR